MPTARGIAVAIASAVSLLIGLVLGYPEFVLLGIAGAVACVLAALWLRGPKQLKLERVLERNSVSRGTSVRALMAVTNTSTGTFLGGRVGDRIVNRNRIPGIPSSDAVSVAVGKIAPGGQVTTAYSIPTDKRGAFDLGPLMFERRDPFGLAQADAQHEDPMPFFVYPRVYSLDGDPLGKKELAPSRTADSAMSANVQFDRLREYVVGDDLRRVHWRTSARTGVLMMRETTDEIVDDLMIVVDDSIDAGPQQQERYESVLEIAASLAAYASTLGQQCRIVTTAGLKATQTARQADLSPILDLLATSVPSERNLRDLIAELRGSRGGNRLYVITVKRDDGPARSDAIAATAELSRKHQRTKLIEVGVDVDGPVFERTMSVWGVENAEAFAKLWPVLESV